jgi:hypothetical protein
MDFAWNTYCVFGVLEVLLVRLWREVKSSIIWLYPPWLDYYVSLHKVAGLIVVIPTNPRSSKWSPDAQVMIVLVSIVSAFSRAGDSGPKCIFAIFVWSFGPKPLGTFAKMETLALGSRNSGRRDVWNGAHLCNGFRDFVTHGRRLGPKDSGPQGRRLCCKCQAMASFRGGPI